MTPMSRRLLVHAAVAAATVRVAASPAHAASDGISRLISVTQLKAQQAEAEADRTLQSADRQRRLIREAKPNNSTDLAAGADDSVAAATKLKQTLRALRADLAELQKAIAAKGC